MTLSIRLAELSDAAAIAAIYRPVVLETPISFELEPPDATTMAERMAKVLERLPWLVCEREGTVLGYVYASPYKERAAYRWSLETTVYIAASARGMGLGRALYTALFAAIRALGYQTLMAGITLPNAGSVGLHEAMGFTPVGVYPEVGYKFGAWHDVGHWRMALRPLPEAPEEPLPLSELLGTPAWDAALAAGQALLRAAGGAEGPAGA